MNKLTNSWTCWIHLQSDTNWEISSYKKIVKFDTLEDSIRLIENLSFKIITQSMVFLMREDILPIWENPDNKNGGSFSYKISNCLIENVWKKLCYYLIGNSLYHDEIVLKNINGISISPKKNFCIIKFWLKNLETIKENKEIINFINSFIDDKEESVIIDNIDPFNIHMICGIDKQICIFRKH